jgi:hypothetical protein
MLENESVSLSDIIYPDGHADIDQDEHGYIMLCRKHGQVREVLMTTRPSQMPYDLLIQRVSWNDFKVCIGDEGIIYISYDESNPLDEFG